MNRRRTPLTAHCSLRSARACSTYRSRHARNSRANHQAIRRARREKSGALGFWRCPVARPPSKPKVTRVAVLINPASASHYTHLQSTEAAAKTLSIAIVPVEAQDAAQIDAAFAKMRQQNAGAVIVILHPFFHQRSQQLADLAAKTRLPSMASASLYSEAGCLMSYGANLYEHYRRTGYFVARILKGRKAAELPVEQPTQFALVLNLKTAKVLGLKIPQSVLIRAERVIE